MAKKTGWTTTSVPTDLAESIESFVNSNEGKKSGYTSKTQFVADAIRDKLERDNSVKPQLDRIEKDLAFLTDKILNEEKRKNLVKHVIYEPKVGFKSIIISETVYDELHDVYQKNKNDLTQKGVNSFAGYVTYMLEGMKQKDKTFARYAPKIEKISVDDDRVILKDNIKNRIAEVAIQKGELFCQLCDEKTCIHVGFALVLPDVYDMINPKKLEKKITI